MLTYIENSVQKNELIFISLNFIIGFGEFYSRKASCCHNEDQLTDDSRSVISMCVTNHVHTDR